MNSPPRIQGDGLLDVDMFDALVDVDDPLPEPRQKTPTEAEKAIARHISSLIEDGSTLQMRIGSIPDAVTRQLVGRKNLGIHTEMWSDGTLALIESGVVTNANK